MANLDKGALQPEHEPQHKVDPQQESFVRDMVLSENGFQPPAVRVFVGYLGLSPRGIEKTDGSEGDAGMPGKWVRLYRTLDFVDFIEVEWKNVLYHKKSTAALLPIEGTILWVSINATIWSSQVRSGSMTAGDFLQGPVTQTALPSAGQNLPGGPVALVDTPSWGNPC